MKSLIPVAAVLVMFAGAPSISAKPAEEAKACATKGSCCASDKAAGGKVSSCCGSKDHSTHSSASASGEKTSCCAGASCCKSGASCCASHETAAMTSESPAAKVSSKSSCCMAGAACCKPGASCCSGAAEHAAATAVAYSPVAAKKVCMLNEMVFEKDQIPVVVDGKTYYGCCEMCREMLQKNADKRYGIDPVNGAKVDKATALIAANADGAVLYFESAENLDYFNKREAAQKQ